MIGFLLVSGAFASNGKDAFLARKLSSPKSIMEVLRLAASGNAIKIALLDYPEDYLRAITNDGGNMHGAANVLDGVTSSFIADAESHDAASELYDPNGFCPLKTHSERVAAANVIGGNILKVVQLINELNAWIVSDGEHRPINPATDPALFENKGLLGLGPSWDDIRAAVLAFGLLPTLLLTDGGNRTTWFNNAAKKTCWEPNLLAMGPMIFTYPQVSAALANPNSKRGYYTATSPQHPDFFHEESPLMIDGPRHKSLRLILELAGFARRYPIEAANFDGIQALNGGQASEDMLAQAIGPVLMKSVWGADPTTEALSAMLSYPSLGKIAIFGDIIHRVALGPLGIAANLKAATDKVSQWAGTTPFRDILEKAVNHQAPGNQWFLMERMVDDLTVATLFAGLVGTLDMTGKCVKFQQDDAAHVALFQEDPEKYLIELMRYDSAVTSVTQLLDTDATFNLEGRNITLAEGTPVQMVLATANRDPTHWSSPDEFNMNRGDLADTLAWHGRVQDVEARSLDKAPRHCAGFCLSIKIASAVCAKMMGSFDKLLAENKILKNGGEIKCTNFNPPPEPPLWNPPQNDAPAPPPFVPNEATGEVLVQSNRECKSADYYVGSFGSLQDCARAVKAAGGKFFIYGKFPKRGWCYLEYTTSSGCPEGLQFDTYDFFDIPEVPLDEALMCHAQEVAVSSGRSLAMVDKKAYEHKRLILADSVGSDEGWTSISFCNKQYKLTCATGGRAVVETYKGCCTTGYLGWGRRRTCNPPQINSNAAPDETLALTNTGDRFEIFKRPEDSSFDVFQPHPALGDWFKVELKAQIVTLRQLMNACPVWIKAFITAVGTAFGWSYSLHSRLIPGNEHNHFVAYVLGKHPDSSALNSDTFDLYTMGSLVGLVHFNLRIYQGADDPASTRIQAPTSMQYLDRATVYDFVGMPMEDIDNGGNVYIDAGASCLIDTLRSLELEDDLTSGQNEWAKVLGGGDGSSSCPNGANTCTKKEYILGIYDKYKTQDGDLAYPAEVINFRGLWRGADASWSDAAETFLAFNHWATHRLESATGDPAVEHGAVFKIVTTDLSSLKHRQGFAQMGADMFFDQDGHPIMIRTPAGVSIWKQQATSETWQYWKFVWRSSAFLKVTLVDHLWATHFSAANSMAAASREALPQQHPMRRLMTMFTFNTIGVNSNALHQLLGPRALLQRSTPFSDFRQVSVAAEASIPSLEKTFGPFIDDTKRDLLHPKVKETPFYAEGQILFDGLSELVDGFFELYQWCSGETVIDSDIIRFFDRINSWSMYSKHAAADSDAKFFGLYSDSGNTLRCQGVRKWLSTHFFHVTGYHRHVGTVADTAADPDFASWGWIPGEAYGKPRQHVQLSLISASTALSWPKLSEDYSHLATGIEKEIEAKAIFQAFQARMSQLKAREDQLNLERDPLTPYYEMHPDYVESSVAV